MKKTHDIKIGPNFYLRKWDTQETIVLEREGPEPHLNDAIELSGREAGNLLSALRRLRDSYDPLLQEAQHMISALDKYADESNWAVNGDGRWTWTGDDPPYSLAFTAIMAMKKFIIH